MERCLRDLAVHRAKLRAALRLAAFVLAFTADWNPLSRPAVAQEAGAPVEQGTFRLHKFEQPIGEETYRIDKKGASLVLTSDFKFKDRFTEVPLKTTLEFNSDLTPTRLAIQGKISRTSAIDAAVEVRGDKVHIRQDKSEHEEPRPALSFLIAGYSPTALQMLLMRYWQAHGSPKSLKTFPGGEVSIEDRGP